MSGRAANAAIMFLSKNDTLSVWILNAPPAGVVATFCTTVSLYCTGEIFPRSIETVLAGLSPLIAATSGVIAAGVAVLATTIAPSAAWVVVFTAAAGVTSFTSATY